MWHLQVTAAHVLATRAAINAEKQEKASTCHQQQGGLPRPCAASWHCPPPVYHPPSPLPRLSVRIYSGISTPIGEGDAPLPSALEQSCSGSSGLSPVVPEALPDMVHPQRTLTAFHGSQGHTGWP